MRTYLFILTGISFLFSCTPSVESIEFGQDECHYCKMSIVDQRYGAEIVTTKGKVFKYDAVECMINAYCDNENNEHTYLHSIYCIDFTNPGKLIDVREALFLISENLPSPMGANITAFPDEGNASAAKQMHGGITKDWLNLFTMRTGPDSCWDNE